MLAITLVASVSLLGASGCATVTSGTVIDKVHEDGYYEQECKNVTTGSGRNRHTTRKCHQEWEDEDRYSLVLKDDHGDTGTVSVTESEFDRYDKGDHYP